MDGREARIRIRPEGEETAGLGRGEQVRDPEALFGPGQAKGQIDRPPAFAQPKLKDCEQVAGKAKRKPTQPLRPLRLEERGTKVALEDR
jgi:hypothetical protein